MPKLKAKRNRFVSVDNEFLTRKDLSLKAKEVERSHQFDDPRNPKVVKSDFRNNNEVVIHHPIGTFPKWEAAIQHKIFIITEMQRA